MISHDAGEVATVVKLFRVMLLVPAVFALALLWRRSPTVLADPSYAKAAPLLPLFLAGFALLVLVNSAGWIPQSAAAGISATSRACLVVAIAALGIKTSFEELAKLGWQPVILMVLETTWLALIFVSYLLWLR